MKKIVTVLLALLLVFSLAACAEKAEGGEEVSAAAIAKDGDVLGEGAVSFSLSITNKAGETVAVTVNTDEETVGAALLALGLVAGETGDYGLYVDTVNGETLSWEKDAMYWAFYIDGECALTGVDMTDITPGAAYALRAES